MVNKKAFSFVEIIITISIIALLAVVGFSAMDSSNEKADNAKVVSDIETINNALEALSQENSELPMPGGNKNFFQANTDYAHSYSGTETFGVYGSITEDTIAKKYLDILPLDPRTNSYYSYGKTKEASQFEVAGVQINSGEASAIVTGNYTAENGPYGLIREYNGSNFVYDKSTNNLPYNPEELVLIATDAQGFVYREGDTIKVDNNGEVYKNNTLLHTGTDDLELFFSDGSVSILEKDSELTLNKLSFPKENNLTTFVQLALKTGTIWTRATNLNDESEFEIYTTDSTAAVRGTIFAVSYDSTNGTDVLVVEGKVEVINSDNTTTILNNNDSIQNRLNPSTYTNTIKTKFSKNTDVRTAQEIEALIAENEIAMLEQETQIIEDANNCFLDGTEIPNGGDITAFNSQSVPTGSSCETHKMIRTCTNGTLSGDSEYKYDTCSVASPTQCLTYSDANGFTSDTALDDGTHDLFKTVNLTPAEKGTITYKRTVTCDHTATPQYTIDSDSIETLSCNTSEGYTPNADGTDCITTGLPTFASAEYNTPGDLSLIKTDGSLPVNPEKGPFVIHSSCDGLIGGNCKDSNFTDRGCINFIDNKSFCEQADGTQGIFLNSNPGNDFLKYHLSGTDKIDDDEDFQIEISVRIPSDTNKHYLISANDFNIYVQDGVLYFNKSGDTFTSSLPLNTGSFNTISAKRINDEVFLKVNDSAWEPTGKTNDKDIDDIVVGAMKLGLGYVGQIDDIINYVKLYK